MLKGNFLTSQKRQQKNANSFCVLINLHRQFHQHLLRLFKVSTFAYLEPRAAVDLTNAEVKQFRFKLFDKFY